LFHIAEDRANQKTTARALIHKSLNERYPLPHNGGQRRRNSLVLESVEQFRVRIVARAFRPCPRLLRIEVRERRGYGAAYYARAFLRLLQKGQIITVRREAYADLVAQVRECAALF